MQDCVWNPYPGAVLEGGSTWLQHKAFPLILTLFLVAGLATGCSSAGSSTSSSTTTTSTVIQATPGYERPVQLVQLEMQCDRSSSVTYVLGTQSLIGNPRPLAIKARVGSRFIVWARFAQRHLGPFALRGSSIKQLCSVMEAGPAGGPASVLEAVRSGHSTISTGTDDCGPCAEQGFRASVSISSN
jgi:hypothetical protein